MERRNPAALKPYDKNSRVHSIGQIEDIRRSIREFGFIRPVVIDEHDMILAGHGAVVAACEESLADIPVHVVAHLSQRQKQAYVIADNKLAQKSTWNFDILSEELSKLSEFDYDLALTGFDEQEIDALLKDDLSILPPGFDTPAPVPSRSVSDGDSEGRAVPDQEEGELIPLGSSVSRSPIDIPKVLFGKYTIPLTMDESERFEREIKTYIDEHGTLAGYFTRYWDSGDPDREH